LASSISYEANYDANHKIHQHEGDLR